MDFSCFCASVGIDFDILNIYYDEFKIEKMAKFDTLIVPIGFITKSCMIKPIFP